MGKIWNCGEIWGTHGNVGKHGGNMEMWGNMGETRKCGEIWGKHGNLGKYEGSVEMWGNMGIWMGLGSCEWLLCARTVAIDGGKTWGNIEKTGKKGKGALEKK